jgi:hypothetical protein
VRIFWTTWWNTSFSRRTLFHGVRWPVLLYITFQFTFIKEQIFVHGIELYLIIMKMINLIFSVLSLFWTNESRHTTTMLCVCPCIASPPTTSEWLNQSLQNLVLIRYHGTWAHPTGYFINLFHQSVRLYVYPSIVARQQLRNTHATIEELWDTSFSMRSASR